MCRNISADCVGCQFRYQSLQECWDICDVPDNVLLEIELERNIKGLGNAEENNNVTGNRR